MRTFLEYLQSMGNKLIEYECIFDEANKELFDQTTIIKDPTSKDFLNIVKQKEENHEMKVIRGIITKDNVLRIWAPQELLHADVITHDNLSGQIPITIEIDWDDKEIRPSSTNEKVNNFSKLDEDKQKEILQGNLVLSKLIKQYGFNIK